MDIRTIRQTRCRIFGSVAKSFPPSTQDSKGVLSRSRYINSEAAQIYDQYIDEGDYSSIIIMQDDGIHANLRYTQQAYVATVMKVTHATFVQFPHR